MTVVTVEDFTRCISDILEQKADENGNICIIDKFGIGGHMIPLREVKDLMLTTFTDAWNEIILNGNSEYRTKS